MVECALLNETLTITSIEHPGEDAGFYAVGQYGVTRIQIVHVAGQGGFVPWFRVDFENGSYRLVNAATIAEVRYAKK